MVQRWKTIDNDGSLVKQTIKKPIDYNGTLTQTIDIPSCANIYHRNGLVYFNLPKDRNFEKEISCLQRSVDALSLLTI